MKLQRIGSISIALCAALGGRPQPVHADEFTLIEKAMREIRRKHEDCEVSIQNYASIRDEKVADQSGAPEDYQFWTFSLGGCGGGNNWSARIAVFKVSDNKLVHINTDRFVWSYIKGADFNDSRAVLYTVTWGPNDGHCCPTVGRSVAFSLKGGAIQTKELRTWTERAP